MASISANMQHKDPDRIDIDVVYELSRHIETTVVHAVLCNDGELDPVAISRFHEEVAKLSGPLQAFKQDKMMTCDGGLMPSEFSRRHTAYLSDHEAFMDKMWNEAAGLAADRINRGVAKVRSEFKSDRAHFVIMDLHKLAYDPPCANVLHDLGLMHSISDTDFKTHELAVARVMSFDLADDLRRIKGLKEKLERWGRNIDIIEANLRCSRRPGAVARCRRRGHTSHISDFLIES